MKFCELTVGDAPTDEEFDAMMAERCKQLGLHRYKIDWDALGKDLAAAGLDRLPMDE
jgi:hypothetical protein